MEDEHLEETCHPNRLFELSIVSFSHMLISFDNYDMPQSVNSGDRNLGAVQGEQHFWYSDAEILVSCTVILRVLILNEKLGFIM